MNDVLRFLGSLDWWSVALSAVDVLIVSFIIYRVLLLIRGSRAAYTLIGLLLVAGTFVVAQRFALNTLRWLLDNILNYLLLIVIIVFQTDIRRGLMRMGRRFFLPARGEEAAATIAAVVEAAEQMVREKVGAIIVFEREVELDELIHSGVEMDALTSAELLRNIFTPWPDNALHDGAVIIRHNRVRRAAALLPLSRSSHVDQALGTRHRAGIGITEETDAIAVVLSEQRGSAAICSHGVIRTGMSVPAMKRELLAMLASREVRRGIVGWAARTADRMGRGRRTREALAVVPPASRRSPSSESREEHGEITAKVP